MEGARVLKNKIATDRGKSNAARSEPFTRGFSGFLAQTCMEKYFRSARSSSYITLIWGKSN